MTVRVARVLPNVTGLDKSFDYLIPEEVAPKVQVGTMVRVELHGRRIGGWVTKMLADVEAAVSPEALKPIAKVTGHGPDAALLDLADWAAVRWQLGVRGPSSLRRHRSGRSLCCLLNVGRCRR